MTSSLRHHFRASSLSYLSAASSGGACANAEQLSRGGRERVARQGWRCARSFIPSPPFLFRFPCQPAGRVWRLFPVGARCRSSRCLLLVMSYGPLDTCAGTRGPRDPRSGTSTASSRRAAATSSGSAKPVSRGTAAAEGAGAVLTRLPGRRSPAGATAKATPEAVSGAPALNTVGCHPLICQAQAPCRSAPQR